ncbi:MAG: hypothetical protein HYZ16_05850 [Bacteroidetes bacterium]|jgi:hypothetical protein|nr:hypothetical protein [Bacteroidota bacterium]
MEDEELLNLILEKLYYERYSNGIHSIRQALGDEDSLQLRKNQLVRVMADLKNNGFVLFSQMEDDFEAQITPEGIVYCEDVLMLR